MRLLLLMIVPVVLSAQIFPAGRYPGARFPSASVSPTGITFISAIGKKGTGPASLTTGTLDITGATSVYVLVTAYNGQPNTDCTVIDNNSHTYTATAPSAATTDQALSIFYFRGLTGAAGYTWSANCGSTVAVSLGVMAFSGAGTSGTEDLSSYHSSLGTPTSSIAAGSITTTVVSLVVTGLNPGGAAGVTGTVPTGYTIPSASGDGLTFAGVSGQSMGLAFAYKIQTASGVENPSWVLSSSDTAAARNASFH